MNRRLSTWILLGAFLWWPLKAGGQKTNSSMARRAILNTPSFQTGDPLENSPGTGASVSVRELSIPGRPRNAYRRGIDRLAKNDPAGSLVHLQRAASEFPSFNEAYYAIGLAELTLAESFPSISSLRGSAEKNAHNLATEIFTILFPPPKHPWIGELSESMLGLTR